MLVRFARNRITERGTRSRHQKLSPRLTVTDLAAWSIKIPRTSANERCPAPSETKSRSEPCLNF
jgi:hypothetical protein